MEALRNEEIGTSPVTLFDAETDGGAVTTFQVENLSADTDVLVTVAGLVTDYPVRPGATQPFRLGTVASATSIQTVTARVEAGTANVNAGPIAKC